MDWFFIKDMLVALGFSSHFVKIVFTCISTSTFSLILNGKPMESLKAKRGFEAGRSYVSPSFCYCNGIFVSNA